MLLFIVSKIAFKGQAYKEQAEALLERSLKKPHRILFDWVLNTLLVLTIKYLHSSIIAEF